MELQKIYKIFIRQITTVGTNLTRETKLKEIAIILSINSL